MKSIIKSLIFIIGAIFLFFLGMPILVLIVHHLFVAESLSNAPPVVWSTISIFLMAIIYTIWKKIPEEEQVIIRRYIGEKTKEILVSGLALAFEGASRANHFAYGPASQNDGMARRFTQMMLIKDPRPWPYSLWFLKLAAFCLLIQLIPYFGYFLGLFGFGYLSIVTINLFMIGILIESYMGRISPKWAVFGLTYFLGYYASAISGQLYADYLASLNTVQSPAIRPFFDADRNVLLINRKGEAPYEIPMGNFTFLSVSGGKKGRQVLHHQQVSSSLISEQECAARKKVARSDDQTVLFSFDGTSAKCGLWTFGKWQESAAVSEDAVVVQSHKIDGYWIPGLGGYRTLYTIRRGGQEVILFSGDARPLAHIPMPLIGLEPGHGFHISFEMKFLEGRPRRYFHSPVKVSYNSSWHLAGFFSLLHGLATPGK